MYHQGYYTPWYYFLVLWQTVQGTKGPIGHAFALCILTSCNNDCDGDPHRSGDSSRTSRVEQVVSQFDRLLHCDLVSMKAILWWSLEIKWWKWQTSSGHTGRLLYYSFGRLPAIIEVFFNMHSMLLSIYLFYLFYLFYIYSYIYLSI